MAARYTANIILPLCGLSLPDVASFLTLQDQEGMLQAAINSAPSEKWKSAADYIFVLTFEQRQGSVGFWTIFSGACYALTLPMSQRHPVHCMLMGTSVLMMLANAHHAGVPFLGYNPMVTGNGKFLGIAFVPFWAVNFYLNYVGFTASKDAANKAD